MPLQTVGCQWNFSTAFNRNNGSKATNVAHSSLSPIKMGIYSHPSQHISNPSPSLSPKGPLCLSIFTVSHARLLLYPCSRSYPCCQPALLEEAFLELFPDLSIMMKKPRGKKIGNPWVGRERGLEPKKRVQWSQTHLDIWTWPLNRGRSGRGVIRAQLFPPQMFDHNATSHWETPREKKRLKYWSSWLKEAGKMSPCPSRSIQQREAGNGERSCRPKLVAIRSAHLLLSAFLQGLISQLLQVHKLFPPVEGIFGEQ